MATANQYVGAARAALGQGLVMGWGDEAEAWLRSKLSGSKGYEAELARINQEYAQYSKENPLLAPTLEFGGGAAPALAAMLTAPATGGATAPAAAAATARSAGALSRLTGALSRLAANPYARGAAVGTGTGAVTGAGSAQPGDRTSGAVSGGTVGAVVGGAAPVVIRGGGAGAKWLRDRVAPSDATVTDAALGKVSRAVKESGMTPKQVEQRVLQDRARNIPSTMANADPALVDLAETVAQRSGPSGRLVEKKLSEQTAGARERTYAQTRKAMQPGNYYDDEAKLVQDLRNKAGSLYDDAYAWGDVDDPKIMRIMQTPEVQGAYETARSIANAQASLAKIRGEDPSKFAMPEIYKPSGKFDANGNEVLELTMLPDVRTLDFMKRGLDAQIKSGYKSDNAAVLANISTIKEIRNDLRDRLKDLVPPYKKALSEYSGEMEVIDAMRSGMNDFNKLDHEQVINMVSKMGNAEKEAFRTGVVRDLYSKIMDPSGNINASQRIIGSPEMQAKLQPLFDSPAKFEMFKSALEREAQLFQQSNRILGGAATGRRTQARERFEEGSGVGTAVADAVSGGFFGSLTNMAARLARGATMTDDVAEKVGKLLMSSDPHEVAAAVKLLDQYDAKAAAGAKRLGKGETGAIMGTVAAFPPSPIDPNAAPDDVETDLQLESNVPGNKMVGPDIDADIEADMKKMK